MTRALVGTAVVAVVLTQSGYQQPFDGAPPAPLGFRAVPPLAAWDVVIHADNTNPSTWLQVAGSPMAAQHGPDCAPPPATHPMTTYADAVFQCHDHIMTSIFTGGAGGANGDYGVIYLTPPALLDFTAGAATLTFDLSTARTSLRDWVDLWLTPPADHVQLPLEDWLPDLQGPPRNAVHLRMDNAATGTMFRAFTVRNFATTDLADNPALVYDSVLTPSATVRSTFQLTLSRTHVKFGMPAYNLWWVDADIPDLGWTAGVVQLGHHDYNGLKDCPVGQTCSPMTWHFDNVNLSAADPFSILRAAEGPQDYTTLPRYTFPSPAPAGALLQVGAFTSALDYSVNGGSTWTAMQRQATSKVAAGLPDTSHAGGWQAAVPAGTQVVTLRGSGGWWGPQWLVQDVALYAIPGVVPPPLPSVVPTLTPSPVVTRLPSPLPSPSPSATATASTTPTRSPTATGSPTPRPTPTSTATGAPSPVPPGVARRTATPPCWPPGHCP